MKSFHSVSFTQTPEYLSWHNAVGTKTFYKEFFMDAEKENIDEPEFQIDDEEKSILNSRKYAVISSVILKLRIGQILYVPYGPVFFGKPTEIEKKEILKYLKDLGKKENCVFIRFEDPLDYYKNNQHEKDEKNFSELSVSPDSDSHLSELLFNAQKNSFHLFHPPIKTFSKEGIFQPRMEWWLDLQESEEEIYNRIQKDHKYSIRRAEKEKIKIEIIENNLNEYFEIFWKLLNETGQRDGFLLYEKEYYRQIFSTQSLAGGLKKYLVFSKIAGEYFSVALIVISDKIANLVFAGSSSNKRELGFNHLMQWEAIRFAKKRGCEIYNFGGITDGIYGKETLKGVTNFKKRFGGYSKFHGNFIDIPIKKIKYFLYILRKFF